MDIQYYVPYIEQNNLIELHYVGVESPGIAKQRIAERVKMGDHAIPDKDVEKRYGESLRNLHGICDLAALYNSTNVPVWYINWQEGCHNPGCSEFI